MVAITAGCPLGIACLPGWLQLQTATHTAVGALRPGYLGARISGNSSRGDVRSVQRGGYRGSHWIKAPDTTL
ncbi:MAG: hypothetical protein RLZZ255_301 [Cyanobacteriota bacterium]